MSTPSTVTALHAPYRSSLLHYQDYVSPPSYTPSAASHNYRTSTNGSFSAADPAPDHYHHHHHHHPQQQQPQTQLQHQQLPSHSRPKPQTQPPRSSESTRPPSTPNMSSSRRGQERKADWAKFYENGIPEEIIVIHDDTPPPQETHHSQHQHSSSHASNSHEYDTSRPDPSRKEPLYHVDKRRRTATHNYDAVYHSQRPVVPAQTYYDDTVSNDSASAGRNTSSAFYSTAPTSLESQTSANGYRTKPAQATTSTAQVSSSNTANQAGQKRKRLSQKEEDDSDLEIISHNAWSTYHAPPKPAIKAPDVVVSVIRDKASTSGQKCDDDDGHYIVSPDTDLTPRYRINKLLGQGTFGKVVEAFDRTKNTKCAVKIIRAVPKYRDASRIELRVLATLKANDKANRNRCIHLRDCFDYKNHICIVTDLLGESVFDFLKRNAFVPFPSTHIQSFARQLLTSVAFLHDLNLIHTDLKPENILLVNGGYQTFTYHRNIPSSSRGISRTAKVRRVLLDPEIRLIDFGSATFDDEYHSSVVSTRHYRAPEIILNLGWSFPCDIWSIGCILVEFFTGDALFQTHDNLEHLAMMEPVCGGKIDKEIIQKVRQMSKSSGKNQAASYFVPRAFRLAYPNEETPRTSRKYVKNMKKLDETITPTTDFNRQFLDLLAKIFVYDPKKRITAKKALEHEWFQQKMQDDGTEAMKIRLGKERAAYSQ